MNPPGNPQPARAKALSVVITIVEGGRAVERCLAALAGQADAPPMEVLVPYDESARSTADLGSCYPAVRFLAMGTVPTAASAASPRGQHELFDKRRSVGLAAATGDVVAILEDRGVPTPDWARLVMRLHAALPHAVIGGAVENAVDRLSNWAVFFCDFSRYQRPFAAGPAAWVTDVNVSYKKRAIDATEPLWRDRYHEPVVHGALAAAGETLFLTPELVVAEERQATALAVLLRERLHWGRLFAYTRVKSAPAATRATYIVLSPLIPLVMLLRQARLQQQKGRLGLWLKASPIIVLLLAAWGTGEAVGYVTGRP